MRKTSLCSLAVLAVLCIVSCKKDSKNNNPFIGNWTFVSAYANVKTEDRAADPGVFYSEFGYYSYTTINNAGSINITADSMIMDGLHYDVSATFYAYSSSNGIITPPGAGFPETISIPAIDSASRYRLIGKDSIYFYQGAFTTIGSLNQITPIPGSAGYLLKNDTLVITTNYYDSTLKQLSAHPAFVINKGVFITTLARSK